MSNDGVNAGRRRFFVAATSVVGAAGAVGAAVPFVGSWFPSAKAKAAGAPVKVNISKIEPGQQMIAEWRGQPVFIVRRTEEILGNLKKIEGQLSDPNPRTPTNRLRDEVRSIKPEILLLSVSARTWVARRPSARKSRQRSGQRLGRWLFLPLPRFPLRSGWPRLQVAACALEPARASAYLRN
jgi:ubiquinol-cytochrome c reductase iron-sulfur subunit